MSDSEKACEIKDDTYALDGDDESSDDDSDSDLDSIGNIFGDLDNFTDIIDPKQNPLLWVQTQISRNVNPRVILREFVPGIVLPDHVPDLSVWRLIFEIITEPTPRQRLPHVSSLENVIHLIKECKNIIVLTGAGVSVSCGIPDFRSRNGIYARLSQDFPDLPDPQAMFDIHFFRCNPCPFFRFAKEIYPGRFVPSLSHYFIQHLEKTGRLLRNYTQNIDTLEQVAGINNVVHCHGSFATATCMNCKLKVKADDIEAAVFAQRIPYCKNCTPPEGGMNILKPDIVFFGEGLPDEFHKTIEKDKEKADLLIVIGSSLKVRPVALIPSFLRPDIPQILINRERLPHMQFDVELYGNCDDVINELCCQLGKEWSHFTKTFSPNPLDKEKYKSFFGIDNAFCKQTSSMQANGNSSCGSDQTILTKVFPDETPKRDGNLSIETSEETDTGHMKQSTNSQDTNENDNSKHSIKRNLKEVEDCVENKRQKLPEVKKSRDSNSVYYLFFPPNRYIFHGAEMGCRVESEDDGGDGDHHCCGFEDNREHIYSCDMPLHASIENVPSTACASTEKGSSSTQTMTQDRIENLPGNTSTEILPTIASNELKVSIQASLEEVPTSHGNVHSGITDVGT